MELEELLVSPQVAQAKGGTDSGAGDNLATERNVGKGWMDVVHEVVEC
jgi:hypothetical protein